MIPKQIASDGKGSWRCICGNTETHDGFFPCNINSDNQPTDKTEGGDQPENWDGLHYYCDKCAAVIEQNTGRIVSA